MVLICVPYLPHTGILLAVGTLLFLGIVLVFPLLFLSPSVCPVELPLYMGADGHRLGCAIRRAGPDGFLQHVTAGVHCLVPGKRTYGVYRPTVGVPTIPLMTPLLLRFPLDFATSSHDRSLHVVCRHRFTHTTWTTRMFSVETRGARVCVHPTHPPPHTLLFCRTDWFAGAHLPSTPDFGGDFLCTCLSLHHSPSDAHIFPI